MRFILPDTHLLIWTAAGAPPKKAIPYLTDPDIVRLFSPVSIWEVVIKRAQGRPDFQVDPLLLYRGLLDNGYTEIAVSSRHTLAVGELPPIHKDPFDRLLIAQARMEDAVLLTAAGQRPAAECDGPAALRADAESGGPQARSSAKGVVSGGPPDSAHWF